MHRFLLFSLWYVYLRAVASQIAFNDFSALFFFFFFADTEDASETDLAKHDDDDYVEIKEQ